MKKSTIGILQADGSFFPVVEETQIGKKRLVLTAARAEQEAVKIDIRCSEDGTTKTGSHLGTLALQKTSEGDIDLVLDLDDQGRLTATAAWPQGGPLQSISVDLNDYRESVPSGAESVPASPSEEEQGEDTRSDNEILSDSSLDDFELDEMSLDEETEPPVLDDSSLDDLTLENIGEGELETDAQPVSDFPLDDLSFDAEKGESLMLDLPDLEDLDFPADEEPIRTSPPESAPSNSVLGNIDDLDEGFGLDEPISPAHEDTLYDFPDLSLDDENTSIELSDEIPSTDFGASESLGSEDEPFELPDWNEPSAGFDSKTASRSEKVPRSPSSRPAPEKSSVGPVDKVALVLSLTTLGLLIIVLLGLLFLNFLKPSSPPALKPEVYRATSGSLAMAPETLRDPLEVPEALRAGTFTYSLKPGDEESDLERLFGPVSAERTSSSWVW